MDEMTKKLKQLVNQSNRGEILGLGIIVKYDNGIEDLQRYGDITISDMEDDIAREKNMANHLGLSDMN